VWLYWNFIVVIWGRW